MSRGAGKVQRAIMGLLEAHPDGAWRVEDICREVYGADAVTKSHRVAVVRSMRDMQLPEGWRLQKRGVAMGEHLVLFNAGNKASVERSHALSEAAEGARAAPGAPSPGAAREIDLLKTRVAELEAVNASFGKRLDATGTQMKQADLVRAALKSALQGYYEEEEEDYKPLAETFGNLISMPDRELNEWFLGLMTNEIERIYRVASRSKKRGNKK